MGCNYYIERNKCDCCGRSDRLHIAKKSFGWDTSFREYKEYDYSNSFEDLFPINTIKKLKEITKKYKIINEYGEYKEYKEFWKDVKERKKKYGRAHKEDKYDKYDNEGNLRIHGEFS